jgi:UDP-glucose 4-epimerase
MEAKSAGVEHYIQMSSIAVYGDIPKIDIDSEECPVNIYGKTKLDADSAIKALQSESFRVTSIRPPMVYGGGNSPGNLMKLLKLLKTGLPLPLRNINNKRDFIHVKNLVEVINIVIDKKLHGIVLPTDLKPVSVDDVVSIFNNIGNRKIRTYEIPGLFRRVMKVILPKTYGKVFGSLTVNCNLSTSYYSPEFDLEDGIKEMTPYL